jgi:hypothetical protein
MSKVFHVQILGWEKINGRNDVNNPSWFKFKHKFFSDPEFFDFTDAEKLCWIYILCEASAANKRGLCSVFTSHCIAVAKISHQTVIDTIKKLQKLHIITFSASRARDVHVTSAYLRQEEKREDKKREEESSEGSFEPVAAAYLNLKSIFLERKVTQAVQSRWLEAFPDSEWVSEQIKTALAWEAAHPARKKKNFAAFITRWLTRGWDQRRVVLQVSKQERPVSKIYSAPVSTQTPEEAFQNAEKIKKIRNGLFKNSNA